MRPFSLLPVSPFFWFVFVPSSPPSFIAGGERGGKKEKKEGKRAQGKGFMREKGETTYDLLPREREKRKEEEEEKEEIECRARCLCVEERERKSDWWDALTPVVKEENLRRT